MQPNQSTPLGQSKNPTQPLLDRPRSSVGFSTGESESWVGFGSRDTSVSPYPWGAPSGRRTSSSEREGGRNEYAAVTYRNYGTLPRKPKQATTRSISLPARPIRRVVVYRRRPRELTVAQQSAKLAERAKKNFFHGSFTSSHGAVFTVPNRAQQIATARPSGAPALPRPVGATGGAPSRSASVNRRAAAERRPLPLDTHPAASAIKKPPVASPLGGNKDLFAEPIVVKPRAASADSRFSHRSEDQRQSSRISAQAIAFRESSPDFIALHAMRNHSATRTDKRTLSPTTVARAAQALKAYEERKVSIPSGSFHDITAVNIDGARVPLPVSSPLVLQRKEDAPKHVHIGGVVVKGETTSEDATVSESTSEEGQVEDDVSVGSALMDLAYLGVPAAVSICFTFSMSVVPLAFIGSYLGERQLTGASVGYFITCILIQYPMVGLTFAMDTLISHEYGRDPQSPEMGLVLQRGVFINLLVLAPLCMVVYNMHNFLEGIYGVEVALVAEEFLTYVPLFLLPIMLFIAFSKFLNNQMQPHLPMIALTAGVIVMPFLQMKLTPMGVKYTMIGMAITSWFQLVVVFILTVFKRETRMTLSVLRFADALNWADVKEYMKLAIPSAIFVAAEASSFDLTVLLCARFGDAEGAAWSGIMNSMFIFASFSGGLSTSACANIGRCIGANQPKSAKRFVLLSIAIGFIMGLLDSTIIVVFFDSIMSLFGTKGTTLQIARRVVYVLPFFHIADSVQFTFQGIFSGLGKNHLGAIILLTALWGIGIPLSFLLGDFLNYGMFGVCVGITIGLCIEAPAMVIAASMLDYRAICDRFILEEEEDETTTTTTTTDDEEMSSEYDEEYVEEVMRRSGIPTTSDDFHHAHTEHYERLLPPQPRGRRRRLLLEAEETGSTDDRSSRGRSS